LNLGPREGDNAPLAIIELLDTEKLILNQKDKKEVVETSEKLTKKD